jgi:quinate dehydrogenase
MYQIPNSSSNSPVNSDSSPSFSHTATPSPDLSKDQQQIMPPDNSPSNPKLSDTSHLSGIAYLFGHPITHSLSPLLHQTVYHQLDLKYSQIPLDSVSIPTFLSLTKDPKFYGASVTMPHKIAIIPYLSSLTPECEAIGACNTAFLSTPQKDGKRMLCGANTDCYGVRDAFLHNVEGGNMFKGKPGMVIGAGGSCRAAVYALVEWLSCSPIYIVNRSATNAEAVLADCRRGGFGEDLMHVKTAEQAKELTAPGAIVSCVPNRSPRTEEEREVRGVIETFLMKEDKGVLLEMCYHPSPYTEIGELAETEGWQVILGTEAMIYQGLEQDCIWTGRKMEELPLEEVKGAIAAALSERQRQDKQQ